MENQLVELPRSRFLRLVLPLYLLVALPYVGWRLAVTLQWGAWYLWLLLGVEMLSIAMTVLYLFTAERVHVPVFRPAAPGRTVDIFIPTVNEPEEVVKMTVIGALAVRGARHVFVLDDGCRLSIRAMADALGARYVARQSGEHAKAGNMNNGLRHSDAEFTLFLDCDHVPQPQIIERLLGYFDDPLLAFVQTPQLFYNVASVQFRPTRQRPLWNEQAMFYEAIQPAKNRFNAAFFCGSGALLRRAAVDDVGGFATGTATEDIHTSLRLHARGWRSLFVPEALAHGIAPVDMAEYHKQRTRWGAGSLGLLFRSPDSPLRAPGLTPAQRLCYFNSTFSFTFGLQRLFYTLFPAVLLLSLPFAPPSGGVPVLPYLAVMLAFVAFSFRCTWALSNGSYHPVYTEQYNIANMFAHLAALRGLFRISAKFSVSAKAGAAPGVAAVEQAVLALVGVLVVANLVGLSAWIGAGRPVPDLLDSMAGLALFWNVLNLLLIVPFAWFLHRHRAKGEPVCAVAVPRQPARLNGERGSWRAAISGLDLKAAQLEIDRGADVLGMCSLTFDTQSGPLSVAGRISGVSDHADGTRTALLELRELAPSTARQLTLHLFHMIVPRTLIYGQIRQRRFVVAPEHQLAPEPRPLVQAAQEAPCPIPVSKPAFVVVLPAESVAEALSR